MIIVECYSDEFLIRCLGVLKRDIDHENGKGEVVNRIRKKDYGVGIIDEDPGSSQPSDLHNYVEIDHKDTIKLLSRINDEKRKIIKICPRFEDWIISRARINHVSLRNYDIPDDPNELHEIPHIEKKRNFQRFIKELTDVDEECKTLRQWIREHHP